MVVSISVTLARSFSNVLKTTTVRPTGGKFFDSQQWVNGQDNLVTDNY